MLNKPIDILLPTNKTKDCIQPLIDEIEKNTPEEHRIIASCQPLASSKNRNYCLSYANSDIVCMLDDDITGFYPGWLFAMIQQMIVPDVVLVSARLLGRNKEPNTNMGMKWGYEIRDKKVTTACLAFYKTDLRFDEEFQLSGYEDTDFVLRYAKRTSGRFVIASGCQLIHLNEMKGQDDKEAWEHNRQHFIKKHPGMGAENQKWWYNK